VTPSIFAPESNSALWRMFLQSFWRSSGPRSLATSATSQLRTFSSSPTTKALSSDPATRRIQQDRYNEIKRIKRRTDPEWATRERRLNRNAAHNNRWKETNREAYLEYLRNDRIKRSAQDPLFVLRGMMYRWARRYAWFRESLPWKSHVPVFYGKKVQHVCSRCVVTTHGSAQVW
jgi:hypothetical protein